MISPRQKIHSHFRPNATPAYSKTAYDIVKEKADSGLYIKNQKRRKRMVTDICDKCRKFVLIRSCQLGLLRMGFKFYHSHCYNKEFGKQSPKGKKIIIGYSFK